MFVFDLDGVLASCENRNDFLKSKDWDAFHDAGCCVKTSTPIERNAALFRNCKSKGKVFIVTGRTEKYFTKTLEWLGHYDLVPDHIYMRSEYDLRPSPEFKISCLKLMEHRNELVNIVFDDRADVIEAVINAGYPGVMLI